MFVQWEFHGEPGGSWSGFDGDLAPVLVDDDAVADIEAQSRPFSRRLGGEEGIEDLVLGLLWNPRSATSTITQGPS